MKKKIIGVALATGMLATAAFASIMSTNFQPYNIADEINGALAVGTAQSIDSIEKFDDFKLNQNQPGFDWDHLSDEQKIYLEQTAMTGSSPCPLFCGGGTKAR